MKSYLFLPIALLFSFNSIAQKREEIFDYQFKPSFQPGGYYFVVTENKDSLWSRKAWYIAQKTLYLEGWYKDDSCKIPHGQFTYYHTTGYPLRMGHYANGKKEGVWLSYNDKGQLTDSSNYHNDKRIGISMSWHENGYPSDSVQFDGAGNGVEVRWHDDGSIAAAGYWKQDTLKRGRWQYFHRNGKLMATEDYDAAGKQTACNCYDEQGIVLDTALCREQEPKVNIQQWRRFLENNLQSLVEQKARERLTGQFTVLVRFLVNTDGTMSDFKALTNYGYGIEEGVVNMLKRGPLWTPGRKYGKLVRSYHTQPITFVISE